MRNTEGTVEKESKKLNDALLNTIVEGLEDKKGYKITVMDLRDLDNAVTDFFVICHGTSSTQTSALADSVIDEVKKEQNISVWHKEGNQNAEWILLDYSNIVVHIFLEDIRTFYKLEDLWGDAKFTTIN
ncbi:MAG: ribosome silencing factor [Hyphomicrobiales bacterium]